MKQWTDETARILANDHVTAATYDRVVASVGFANYVKSRGGVFARCYDKTGAVKTLSDFRERMEYVMGLMVVFGLCYWNGEIWYNSPHPFYSSPIKNKGCREGSITQLCTGAGGRLRITNCNYGVDTAFQALGISGKKKGQVTKKANLKPGDRIDFYRKSDGKWHHVVMVHSIEGGKVWCYDFGSRFIKTGKPLHYMVLNDFTAAGGEYGTDKWKAWHIVDLEEEEPVKDDRDKAVEMYKAVQNAINVLKKEYGEDVTSIVYDWRLDYDDFLRAAADYVLDEFAGKGEARKVFFGEDYDDVQDKVNWVYKTAQDVILGKYGNGEIRRAALGADYDVVQNEVERLLK